MAQVREKFTQQQHRKVQNLPVLLRPQVGKRVTPQVLLMPQVGKRVTPQVLLMPQVGKRVTPQVLLMPQVRAMVRPQVLLMPQVRETVDLEGGRLRLCPIAVWVRALGW